ncbi:ABC transporter permease [Halovenus rubra]|uniref:ABC transporter permease n=2 Tax=Halovenus rubra TaxID=869890 RepID=A0ACC7DXU3_9EURY|nr:ABC transporter permease [Halovenus rubra]
MATEQPDTFDEVNWESVRSSSGIVNLALKTKLMLITTLPLLALWLYDRVAVGQREKTFVQLGKDLGLSGPFETLGLTWNPAGLDYIFIFTIFLFAFYMILPLYENPRMTRYYWKEFKRNRPAVVSLVWLAFVFVVGIIGPLFIDKPEPDILKSFQPPVYATVDTANIVQCVGEASGGTCQGTWQHPLGTTGSGRDVLAFMVHGTTITMKIAFITTLIVALIGISVGTISAYSGGWVDETLMRMTDIVLAFPTLIFFLMITYIYGASLGLFIVIFATFAWGGAARYIRSKALSVAEEEFIDATRISGASRYRVVRRHIVPNTASSIITNLTLLVPGFLLAEAQLSFLGLGDAGLLSWGQLIASGRSSLEYAPWIILAPGFILFFTILAFNFLGDALLDALNPEAESEAEK